MAISAWTGPLAIFGQATYGDTNPQRGSSLFDQGIGLMDPRRPYYPGSAAASKAYGWYGVTQIPVIDVVPVATGAAVIAAAAVQTAGTPMTLVSTSGSGVTVNQSVRNLNTGATVTGLLAIDGAATPLSMGQDGTINLYNPANMIARNVTLTSSGNDSGATFTVVGFDVYGAPMVETITGANAGTAVGKKAFKYIQSITPAGTLAAGPATVSAGIGSVFGLPLFVGNIGDALIVWNNAIQTNGTFVAGDTTTATATTGDVRGTYVFSGGTLGTSRAQIYVTPKPANVALGAEGLFGVPQFGG